MIAKAALPALATTLVLAAAAHAAELNTATLQNANDAGISYVCLVSNLGRTPTSPTVQILDLAGAPLHGLTLDLAPGQTFGIAVAGSAATTARCRVRGAFSKSRVAVSFALRENLGRTLVAVTAP